MTRTTPRPRARPVPRVPALLAMLLGTMLAAQPALADPRGAERASTASHPAAQASRPLNIAKVARPAASVATPAATPAASAATVEPPPWLPSATQPDDAAETSDEAFRADAESKALSKVGPLARREGMRLMLMTTRGRPAVLDSRRPEPGDTSTPYVDFRFDGMTKDQAFFIVRATLTFGAELLWISREDGQRYEMHGNVHPSPDGLHLIVTNASEGVEFNGIKIWERDAGRLTERFKLQPTQEQAITYRFMRWRDPNTVELEQYAQLSEENRETCPSGVAESLAVLARSSGQWILRSASYPSCQR